MVCGLQVVDETERHAIVAHLNGSNVFDDNAGNPFDTSQSLSPIDLATNSADLTAQNIQANLQVLEMVMGTV